MKSAAKPLRPSTPVHYVSYQPLQMKLIFCHLLEGDGTWSDKELTAPFWRLYWNPTPGARVRLGDQCIDLIPSTVALVAPYTSYTKEADCWVEHFHMHFFAGTIFNTIRNAMFAFAVTDRIREELEEVIALLYRDQVEDLHFLIRANGILFWALTQLSAVIPSPPRLNPRIQEICSYLDQHFMLEISNDSLAARLSMNTNAFIGSFKKATGLTPRQYILRKRIEEACALLQFSDKSIDTIADDVGFCSRDYFTRIFSNFMGMGPGIYRKTRLGGGLGDSRVAY